MLVLVSVKYRFPQWAGNILLTKSATWEMCQGKLLPTAILDFKMLLNWWWCRPMLNVLKCCSHETILPVPPPSWDCSWASTVASLSPQSTCSSLSLRPSFHPPQSSSASRAVVCAGNTHHMDTGFTHILTFKIPWLSMTWQYKFTWPFTHKQIATMCPTNYYTYIYNIINTITETYVRVCGVCMQACL